jgi:hypothetical protein
MWQSKLKTFRSGFSNCNQKIGRRDTLYFPEIKDGSLKDTDIYD